MIDEALLFLKQQLNAYLKSGINPDESTQDQVVFVDGQNMDPLTFPLGAVSCLLINLEEENTLRQPNPYVRVAPNGTQERVNPEIKLYLYVLFVARYKQYEDSLRYLSLIIRYFQSHRVFDHQNAPELSDDIEQLIVELITLPFSEQNEVWNALRVTYHPSVLYKVKLLVFRDEEATGFGEVTEKILRTSS